MSERGFIKLIRSQAALELMSQKPKVFALLALIAFRAKRADEFSVNSLQIGEAFIGDLGSMGLSEREYRTAKKLLERWRFASFRGTSRGTIAKLLDKRIFDINPEARDEQRTDEGRARDEQRTTNKKEKKKKNEKIEERRRKQQIEIFRNKFLRKAAMPTLRSWDLER